MHTNSSLVNNESPVNQLTEVRASTPGPILQGLESPGDRCNEVLQRWSGGEGGACSRASGSSLPRLLRVSQSLTPCTSHYLLRSSQLKRVPSLDTPLCVSDALFSSSTSGKKLVPPMPASQQALQIDPFSTTIHHLSAAKYIRCSKLEENNKINIQTKSCMEEVISHFFVDTKCIIIMQTFLKLYFEGQVFVQSMQPAIVSVVVA